ncbi:Origin recognition complex, subunit 1, partial [Coemansia sp. RSA 2599]
MSESKQRGKVASRLEKAARQAAQPRTKRRQHAAYDTDSEDEVEVEWGERLDAAGSALGSQAASATPSTRRVTRHSGMTNKQLYKSVVVNQVEYRLGQTVEVKSTGDVPHLATIYKLWENETGEKQVVARWLLRRSEMYLSKKKDDGVVAEPNEVFYSNADDLIGPETILAPLEVLSYAKYRLAHGGSSGSGALKKGGARVAVFCRRYFNEKSADVGDLDWDEFYHGGLILDPKAEAEMFRSVQKKPLGKEAATKVGRQKVASRSARAKTAAKTQSGASKRRRKQPKSSGDGDGDGDNGEEGADSEFESEGAAGEDDDDDDDEEEEDFVASKTPAKRPSASV